MAKNTAQQAQKTNANKAKNKKDEKKQDPIFQPYLADIKDVLWANGIYDRSDLEWYTKFNRFGALDPYNAVGITREYLFFTKPDLHIVTPWTSNLNPELKNQTYFHELLARYPYVVSQLQSSSDIANKNPFMAILSNAVKNTLELPTITSTVTDTPATIYGTAYNYRGWGFNSDEKVEFSLEFEDSKYLEIYNLVKAYEEYERLKHIGLVSPPNIDNTPSVNGKCYSYYIKNKILHDQFSIYKFIVSDDGETIIYYAKLWGVFFKNVPRDTFSDMNTDGGLKLAVEFEAAFVEDMNPSILTDFNKLVNSYRNSTKDLPIYNTEKRMIDGRWATMPIIAKVSKDKKNFDGSKGMQYTYKLKWRI